MKQNQIIREMHLRIEALEKEVALLRHQVERLSIEDESDRAANFHLFSCKPRCRLGDITVNGIP